MTKKIASFPPAFVLSIMLNANHYFTTSFESLEDLADKEKWQVGCDRLHECLVKWLEDEGAKNGG